MGQTHFCDPINYIQWLTNSNTAAQEIGAAGGFKASPSFCSFWRSDNYGAEGFSYGPGMWICTGPVQ